MSKGNIYFKNLDGLRFLAAFAVICFHSSIHLNFPENSFTHYFKIILSFNGNGGFAAVNFFFVLSGYLITYLMFEENKIMSRFSIPYFYFRRVLRIWPLYFFTLLVGFIIYPLIANTFGNGHTETASGLLYSLFLANFDHIYYKFPATGILGVQWSVAIEEQFYLMWPLLFYFVRDKNKFPFAIILLIVVSNIFQFVNQTNATVTYYHTFCAFNDLSVGALFAYVSFFYLEKTQKIFSSLNFIKTLIVYATGFLLIFFKSRIFADSSFAFSYRLLSSLFFVFIILEQNYSSNSLFKISKFKFATQLGKISYGLYLLHMIPITLLAFLNTRIQINFLLQFILVVVLTIILSMLSYKFLEKFFLNLKNKYSFIKHTN